MWSSASACVLRRWRWEGVGGEGRGLPRHAGGELQAWSMTSFGGIVKHAKTHHKMTFAMDIVLFNLRLDYSVT